MICEQAVLCIAGFYSVKIGLAYSKHYVNASHYYLLISSFYDIGSIHAIVKIKVSTYVIEKD